MLMAMKKTIVVKIGSLGVSSPTGGAETQKIARLFNDLIELKNNGYQILLVSSGAINCGKLHLPKPKNKEETLSYQQACASIGQPILMNQYEQIAQIHHQQLAQILVTHEDFRDRRRFLNIRNTLLTLVENNILPIINENDTVSTQEITVGDNDQLAAMIAEAVSADSLVLLTESDGLYDRDPKDPEAKHFKSIDFKEDFSNIEFAQKSSVGRGGMKTKIEAIRKLTPLGLDVYLATFDKDKAVTRAMKGQGGTHFKGDPREKVKSRKAWIATVVKTGASVSLDEGAYLALKKGGSLLPVGVKKIDGSFRRGDVVSLKYQNKIIGFGMSEYNNKDAQKIKGKKSHEFEDLLKEVYHEVLVHRDNLFLKRDDL